jgi:hypothetical protein
MPIENLTDLFIPRKCRRDVTCETRIPTSAGAKKPTIQVVLFLRVIMIYLHHSFKHRDYHNYLLTLYSKSPGVYFPNNSGCYFSSLTTQPY